MKNYRTHQRRLLMDFFESHCDTHFSVEEIAREISEISPISVSAVYRNVDKMVKEGFLQRLAKPGSRSFLYQYTGGTACLEQMHIQCVKCGRIAHLDSSSADILKNTVRDIDGFSLDSGKTILYGLCRNCR